MELMSSTMKEPWKYGAFWSLAICLILVLFLNQNQEKISFLVPLGDFHFQYQSQYPPSYTINPTKTMEGNVTVNHDTEKKPGPNRTGKKRCNIFEGKWVYKAEQDPSYNKTQCPFIEEKFSCRNNGRPDFEYEKWRWQPRDCHIPLFNGKDMLERLRNKRMIIVGDSLNRNQWESLACLLYSSIPPSRAEVNAGSPTYKVLKAKDYNCTVEFYWSPFLVEIDQTHESSRRVLVLDKLSGNAKEWRGADVMVFNSGHWWTHPGKLKSWDVFEYNGQLIEEMPIEVAFKRAMKTWSKWMENNVNPKQTKVFFRSISAVHYGNNFCYNSTQPIMDESFEPHFPRPLIDVVEGLVQGSTKPQVEYLNITKLSQYRRDAHPSMYRSTQWKNGSFPMAFVDCSHWCLPGLPDTWNQLLYASLFFS